MPQVAFSASYNDVDIYSSVTKQWTTAVLSQARELLCGTSLPKQGLAFFAGGAPNLGQGIIKVSLSTLAPAQYHFYCTFVA
jgi:hypothetical protein